MGRKVTKSSPASAAILRALVQGFGRLSLPAAQRLGRSLGTVLWWIPNRLRSVSRRNIERCFPELDEVERRRLVKVSLIATGMNVTEAGAMWHWPVERLRELTEGVDGEDLLQSRLASGRGVVLLAPHVGNWEYLSYFLTRRFGLLSLYRPPRIAEFDAYIRRSRQRLGAEMVPATTGGLRRLAKALLDGRLTGILPDQEPLKSHGVFAPFFGIPALTMTLVASLLQRFDPAVVYAYAQRTATGRFLVRIVEPPEGLDDPDPITAAARLNYGVERCVRACPEQYMWSYRRFRTRPPQELAQRQGAQRHRDPRL